MEAIGNKIARAPVLLKMGNVTRPALRVISGRADSSRRARAAHDTYLAFIGNRDDFQRTFLPHLDASFNLARWLTGNDADAQDVVQEAYLRAMRFSAGFRGDNPRAWLLTIVRNSAYTWMSRRTADQPAEFDEELHSAETPPIDAELIRKADSAALRAAIAKLPTEFRETIVLRDLEGFSYKEIAEIADVPVGTVMSRLARGRRRLRIELLKAAGL